MKQFWTRLGGPARIGLAAALIGSMLTVIGILGGNFVPLTPRSLLLGILIGGGSWGVVSWAVAWAARDAMTDSDD